VIPVDLVALDPHLGRGLDSDDLALVDRDEDGAVLDSPHSVGDGTHGVLVPHFRRRVAGGRQSPGFISHVDTLTGVS
jgi:hypothetical protein